MPRAVLSASCNPEHTSRAESGVLIMVALRYSNTCNISRGCNLLLGCCKYGGVAVVVSAFNPWTGCHVHSVASIASSWVGSDMAQR